MGKARGKTIKPIPIYKEQIDYVSRSLLENLLERKEGTRNMTEEHSSSLMQCGYEDSYEEKDFDLVGSPVSKCVPWEHT